MDRSSYNQQIRVALTHARRKMIKYGMPLSVVQLSIVISGFVVFYSYPEKVLIYYAIAVPVCIVAICLWAIPMSKEFTRYAPCCPTCRKPLGLLTWRKATVTGLCPSCREALFGP